MLILTRRVGETVMIGDDVTVTVLGVKGNQVRVGVNAPNLFAALASAGINVHMVATSEIKISVLVGEKDLEAGARALHRAFELEKEPTLAQAE